VRILLDECVPSRLKAAFPGQAVQTVTEAGWRTSKDRPLLLFAQERFDLLVTIDRKLEREYDLATWDS
jgi:predicted nuclease of predicted toxin-antitoxin system